MSLVSPDQPGAATRSTEAYERLNRAFASPVDFSDPYDSRDIAVDWEVQTPMGEALRIPAFYDARLCPERPWQVRFTPRSAGAYQAMWVVRSGGEVSHQSEPERFVVEASRDGARGFLRQVEGWGLRFENGERVRGVGINFAWEEEPGRRRGKLDYRYETFLPALKAAGATFFRTWSCPWNLPLIWNTPSPRHERYDLQAAAKLDAVVALSEGLGLCFMFCLDYHGALKLVEDYWGGNAFWPRHPYNRENGGTCTKPEDLFTDAAARHDYRDRLRYIVARWGYSPALGVFELWNEIDNAMEGDRQPIAEASIVDWHREMTAFLKKLDPYGRPVATSLSHTDIRALFSLEHIDFTQLHLYCRSEELLEQLERNRRNYGKPVIVGEFGYDWRAPEDPFAHLFNADLKLALWRALFSETPVLPLAWWWELHYENGGLPILKVAAEFAQLVAQRCNWEVAPVALPRVEGLELQAFASSEALYLWVRRLDASAPMMIPLQELPTQPQRVLQFDLEAMQSQPADAALVRRYPGNLELSAADLPDMTVLILEH
ncbi:MAG: hypothetical protein E1N59_1151 [Puniceicoccaceae bacterium 5H]|nr:MAG: hypothetical protein E1N59_1151 [Puniceicoccaceae bacterium 5H]